MRRRDRRRSRRGARGRARRGEARRPVARARAGRRGGVLRRRRARRLDHAGADEEGPAGVGALGASRGPSDEHAVAAAMLRETSDARRAHQRPRSRTSSSARAGPSPSRAEPVRVKVGRLRRRGGQRGARARRLRARRARASGRRSRPSGRRRSPPPRRRRMSAELHGDGWPRDAPSARARGARPRGRGVLGRRRLVARRSDRGARARRARAGGDRGLAGGRGRGARRRAARRGGDRRSPTRRSRPTSSRREGYRAQRARPLLLLQDRALRRARRSSRTRRGYAVAPVGRERGRRRATGGPGCAPAAEHGVAPPAARGGPRQGATCARCARRWASPARDKPASALPGLADPVRHRGRPPRRSAADRPRRASGDARSGFPVLRVATTAILGRRPAPEE